MKVILLIFITISISAFSQSTSTVFPGVKWMEAPPEEVGINTALLKQAVNFLEQNSGSDGAQELMIIRQGKLIYKGDSIYKVHGVWSCTKSFTSTVLGLLIDDQKAELHTLSRTIIPEMARSYPD
ncbi:MAG: hypothetical protein HKN76_17900, partial [Saprospiraceae bacterium]|nr:hypothetical protein [Saprospiraceae bacterium]